MNICHLAPSKFHFADLCDDPHKFFRVVFHVGRSPKNTGYMPRGP